MDEKMKSLLIGAASGAALGATLAWVANEGDDDEMDELGQRNSAVSQLGPGDYIALGISILTLARQFSNMLRKS
jgi:hypothetical protein